MEDHEEHNKQEAASHPEHGHRGNQGPHSFYLAIYEKSIYLQQDTASLCSSLLFTTDGGTALAYNRVFRLTLDRTS